MKTAVVQRALDGGGMGRYQWCIFFLCGFGYALDLMWAQAFSLVTPRIQQELGISDEQYGDIFSVFSAGLTVGALVWGVLVDVIGRRWAFNLTVGIVAVFGLVLGALNSWSALCAITFFVGFGLGGNIPIDATIVLEFLPNDRRYLLAALSVFQPIGVIITSLLSWALVPKFACTAGLPACFNLDPGIPVSADTCCTKASNYGWRYTLFTLGGLSVLAFVARFGLFTFEESPKFLVGKGRDQEAVDVVRRVRAFNDKKTMTSWGRAIWSRRTHEDREDEVDDGDAAEVLSLEDLDACEKEWEERERASLECAECDAVDGQGLPRPPTTSAAGPSSSSSGSAGNGKKGEEDVEARLPPAKAEAVKVTGIKKYVGHLSALFSTWGMARLTILTWICYAADYWGFVIAGNFLPKFLADRGAEANESTFDTYRNYIIIAVVGVPGVMLGAALIEIPNFGRKWAMVLSSAMMGTSLFLYATITTPAASVGFNAMEYFFQSTFNAVLYGWTPEAFPAAVRGSACGLASFWGRLSSIVAPLAAAHLGDSTGVLYLAGGGVLVCTVTALFLPDTKESDVL
ncbi:MFS general substrate transporter [Trametopsis cervina]|nr:MFS general substrate transporter [Trametopsis cervina]